MNPPSPKERVNRVALGRFERWALPRLARKLPAWVTPDHLTLIGLFSALLIAAAYVLTWYSLAWLWLASLGFVIHWAGDSLDGTLARVRGIQRERYGFYVDHQADAISALLIFTGLGLSPLMPLAIGLALLAGYLLMMVMVSIVAIARDVFKISFGGAGPTEARLVMIGVNTIVFLLGNPQIDLGLATTTLFGWIGGIGSLILLGYYTVFSLRERSALARLDPPPASSEKATLPPDELPSAEENVLETPQRSVGSR